MTYLAISEDCTGGGSSVLSGVDGVGLGRSDSDDWLLVEILIWSGSDLGYREVEVGGSSMISEWEEVDH